MYSFAVLHLSESIWWQMLFRIKIVFGIYYWNLNSEHFKYKKHFKWLSVKSPVCKSASLKTQVASLQVSRHKSQVLSLKTQVSRLKSQDSSFKSQDTSLKPQVSRLQGFVQDIYGVCFTFFSFYCFYFCFCLSQCCYPVRDSNDDMVFLEILRNRSKCSIDN